jgi:SAM-dependent methyltransferase
MSSKAGGATQSKLSMRDIASRCQFSYRTVAKVDRRHFWYVTRNERIFSLIKQKLPALHKASFLDVGCGCANVTGYLYEHGVRNITGWDLNPRGIEICRVRYPQIKFQLQDFLASGQKETFDALGLFDCIEHISDDVQALEHLRGLIKPGGRIFITVPALDSLWSKMDDFYGHFRRYSKDSLKKALTESGFSQVECTYIMAPLVPLLMVRRKLRRIKDCKTSEEIDEVLSRDARLPNIAANEVLKMILRVEEKLLGNSDIGFGASLIATAVAPL